MTDEEIRQAEAFHPEIGEIAKKVARKVMAEHMGRDGHVDNGALLILSLLLVVISVGCTTVLLHYWGMP